MIRNRIDDQDAPMKWEVGRLVVDVRQQRLEHRLCPDCPTKLTNRGHKRGWFGCRCCGRAWRQRREGLFDEQVSLDPGDCRHYGCEVAGSSQGPDPVL